MSPQKSYRATGVFEMTKDMIERLRDGYVSRAKRWSGDTHSGLEGGEVDVAATEYLMKAAADELEASAKREAALAARVAELEGAIDAEHESYGQLLAANV